MDGVKSHHTYGQVGSTIRKGDSMSTWSSPFSPLSRTIKMRLTEKSNYSPTISGWQRCLHNESSSNDKLETAVYEQCLLFQVTTFLLSIQMSVLLVELTKKVNRTAWRPGFFFPKENIIIVLALYCLYLCWCRSAEMTFPVFAFSFVTKHRNHLRLLCDDAGDIFCLLAGVSLQNGYETFFGHIRKGVLCCHKVLDKQFLCYFSVAFSFTSWCITAR